MNDFRTSIPGPDDITRVELPNGIIVLARANFHSPSVVVSGSLPGGSLFDPAEKLGLANFTAAALMRGTARYDHQKLFDALESVGASLGFSGRAHTVGFGGRALAEDLGLVLDILSQTLRHPAFPPGQVEKLRAQILTGLALRAENTAAMASLVFDKLLYSEHPYSRPSEGFPETVTAISPDDLANFRQSHYGPRGLAFSIGVG